MTVRWGREQDRRPAGRDGPGRRAVGARRAPRRSALAFLVLPLVGLLVRAPWATLPARLAEPQVLEALRLSLVTATAATAVCLVLGVPLAWLLARVRLPRPVGWCGRW